MEWSRIAGTEDIEKLKEESYSQPVLLFKHSTRCSISSVALSRFEKAWPGISSNTNAKPIMVKVVEQRPISNIIAETWKIRHESPQLLLIKDGDCVYNASHLGIDLNEALDTIKVS